MDKYFCTNCKNRTSEGLRRGKTWIEVIAWFCYIIPGIAYTAWRRSGDALVCPVCNQEALVNDASLAANNVECEWCGEDIKASAKICKHCNKEVTPPKASGSNSSKDNIWQAEEAIPSNITPLKKHPILKKLVVAIVCFYGIFFVVYQVDSRNKIVVPKYTIICDAYDVLMRQQNYKYNNIPYGCVKAGMTIHGEVLSRKENAVRFKSNKSQSIYWTAD